MCISKNRMLFAAMTAVLQLGFQVASGNAVTEVSLEQKVRHSGVVIIGQVESLTATPSDGDDSRAVVRVVTVLKGKPQGKIEVTYRGLIAEQNPMCCTVGHRYLFFLQRTLGGRYQS